MRLKFRPRVLYLSSKASLLQEQERHVFKIQTSIANLTSLNRKGQLWWNNNHMRLKFRPRVLYLSSKALFLQEQQRNVSEIQTTIADFTITNRKGQFWGNNNKSDMCLKFRLVFQTLQVLTERVNCGGIIRTYVSEIQTTCFMLILKSVTFRRTRTRFV